jgi:hypothetical protein
MKKMSSFLPVALPCRGCSFIRVSNFYFGTNEFTVKALICFSVHFFACPKKRTKEKTRKIPTFVSLSQTRLLRVGSRPAPLVAQRNFRFAQFCVTPAP